MKRTEMLTYLIDALCKERNTTVDDERLDYSWESFRALVNARPPKWPDDEFLSIQDQLLQEEIAHKGITHACDLPASRCDKRLSLWQGDITTLEIDAIVNAANAKLLGCWIPGHHCIDNAIHTYAGVQLRYACNEIMQKQGHDEPAGQAKITPGFNLPARYVLHTIGPIVMEGLTREDCTTLAQCYRSCLDLAAQNQLARVAFCCISTGVFGFPQQEAAAIAVDTVIEWFDTHDSTIEQVVFNVFLDKDFELYQELLDLDDVWS